jgi:hypothetical protein
MARQHAAAAALFVALAIVMTWPLTTNLNRAVDGPHDPFLNTWILDWDYYAAFHRPLSLFDANIFYPARHALAYSENLFGIAILLFPLRAAGASPITAHNLAILGGFAFSGLAAYLLGRLVTDSGLAGLTAGVFYAFVPFRFTHLPHVQFVQGGTLPLTLAALLFYARRPTWTRAILFAAAFLFNGLSNIHYLLFGSVAIAITLLIVRAPLKKLAICTSVALLLLTPFLYPYLQVARMYKMERSWQETLNYSAIPVDWTVSTISNRLYAPLRNPTVDPELWLFPGALSLIAGAVAFGSRDRRSLLIGLAWIALGFIGSLGLHAFFHRFLFSYIPGFRAIRVPARWAVISYVGLSIMVALTTAMIVRRRRWIAPLVAAAFVLELNAAPIRLYVAQTTTPLVERWISETQPHALIELPLTQGRQYFAVLNSTVHHRPIVNGVSGFIPPDYARIASLADQGSDALDSELARRGVTHIVVHADWMSAASRAWLARAIGRHELAFVRRFDAGLYGDWVFTIGGTNRTSPELDAMLRGEPTYNETTSGALLYPQWNESLTSHAFFSGFAFSPYGLREVNLLFNAGAIRLPTLMQPDPGLSARFPWYGATTRPRFFAGFSKRPPGVWKRTDVQVEIIDGRDQRTLLEDVIVDWP